MSGKNTEMQSSGAYDLAISAIASLVYEDAQCTSIWLRFYSKEQKPAKGWFLHAVYWSRKPSSVTRETLADVYLSGSSVTTTL